MFFEQYSHEPYIAVARFICGWTPPDSPRRADLPKLRERGYQALGGDGKASGRERVVQRRRGYGIADIALFAYTHCADDGGFDLARIPAFAPGSTACARSRVSCRCRRCSENAALIGNRAIRLDAGHPLSGTSDRD